MLRARNEEVTTSIIDGDATLINLNTRIYYALDGLGAAIWAALVAGTSRDLLIAQIGPQAGTDDKRFAADLDQLLATLLAEALIEEVSGMTATSAETVPIPKEYVTPILQRFDDLRDHLALDPPLPLPKSLTL